MANLITQHPQKESDARQSSSRKGTGFGLRLVPSILRRFGVGKSSFNPTISTKPKRLRYQQDPMCFGRKGPSRVLYMEQNFTNEQRIVLDWIDDRLSTNEPGWATSHLRDIRILAVIIIHLGPSPNAIMEFRDHLRHFTKLNDTGLFFDTESEDNDMEFVEILGGLGLTDFGYLERHIDLVTAMLWSSVRERAIIEARSKSLANQPRLVVNKHRSWLVLPPRISEENDRAQLESTYRSNTVEKKQIILSASKENHPLARGMRSSSRRLAGDVPPLPEPKTAIARAELAYEQEIHQKFGCAPTYVDAPSSRTLRFGAIVFDKGAGAHKIQFPVWVMEAAQNAKIGWQSTKWEEVNRDPQTQEWVVEGLTDRWTLSFKAKEGFLGQIEALFPQKIETGRLSN